MTHTPADIARMIAALDAAPDQSDGRDPRTWREVYDARLVTDQDVAYAHSFLPKPEITAGRTYKINPRYDFHRTIYLRVTSVVHEWISDDGRDNVAVVGYRVRPSEPNVSFGNERGHVAERSQFELVEVPA